MNKNDRCWYAILELRSRIPIPVHVDASEPEWKVTPDFVEPSVSGMVVSDEVTMSSIAERSVGAVLTVAKFIVSAFADVELNGSAASHASVTGSVAAWVC